MLNMAVFLRARVCRHQRLFGFTSRLCYEVSFADVIDGSPANCTHTGQQPSRHAPERGYIIFFSFSFGAGFLWAFFSHHLQILSLHCFHTTNQTGLQTSASVWFYESVVL